MRSSRASRGLAGRGDHRGLCRPGPGGGAGGSVARRDPLMRGMSFACIMGASAILIHSWVDFNLQIPANAMLFMVLLALGWISLWPRSRRVRQCRARERLEPMRILVTGAAGFIGFHLAKRLLERGDTVVGLDDLNAYYDVRPEAGARAGAEEARSILVREGGSRRSDGDGGGVRVRAIRRDRQPRGPGGSPLLPEESARVCRCERCRAS